jgi:hypothetical protein
VNDLAVHHGVSESTEERAKSIKPLCPPCLSGQGVAASSRHRALAGSHQVYHLCVPDLWRDNLRRRKEHDSLADRIACKVAQRARLKAKGTSGGSSSGDEAW